MPFHGLPVRLQPQVAHFCKSAIAGWLPSVRFSVTLFLRRGANGLYGKIEERFEGGQL